MAMAVFIVSTPRGRFFISAQSDLIDGGSHYWLVSVVAGEFTKYDIAIYGFWRTTTSR
jgi:hypothetical protein